LKKVQQALRQAVAEAVEKEKGLGASLASDPPDRARYPAFQRLEQWAERLRGLKACVEQAERKAAEADAALRASEEGIREGLAAAAAVRQKLADWEGGKI
jgi:hypothetical protein